MDGYYNPAGITTNSSGPYPYDSGLFRPNSQIANFTQPNLQGLYFDTFAAHVIPDSRNIIAPSGQYLAGLEQMAPVLPSGSGKTLLLALAELRASFERAAQLAEIQTLAYIVAPETAGVWVESAQPAPTFGHAVEAVLDRWNLRFFFCEGHHLVKTIEAERKKRAIKNFFRLLHLTRRLVHRTARPFCGRKWSRRLWHLLHGSHPPKAEGSVPCSAFGCV